MTPWNIIWASASKNSFANQRIFVKHMLCYSDVLGPGNIAINSLCLWFYVAYILGAGRGGEREGERERDPINKFLSGGKKVRA